MSARQNIREALATLFPPGAVVEVRMLHTKKGTISGYFDDMEKLAECAEEASGQVPAVYVTLNECQRDLLARSHNRVQGYSRITTSDDQILRRRWLGIDCDPVRPSGISATDAEHDAALARAIDCRQWLRERGWPAPLFADSGNGGHLLFPIDLPNEPAARDLLSRVLSALAFRFDDAAVKIDQATFNASRIWKLYGTLACKGDDMPERPHRLAQLLEGYELREPVTVDQLGDVAVLLPTEPKRESRPAPGEPFDLDRWIADHGLNLEAASWQGGRKWVFGECPWNPDHTDRSAYLVQFPSGAIAAGCHHNGCAQNHWHELRDRLEPGWRDRLARNGAAPAGAAREVTGSVREEALQPSESPDEWDDPIPLYSVTLPEFPVDALPSYLKEMVEATAIATQTPPDLAAMVSLAVLATALQKRTEALIREGWREVLSLWPVTALAPGNRKTAAYGPIVAPVQEYERLQIERMRGEIAEAKTEYEVMEGSLKRLKEQAIKAKNQFDRDDLTRQAVAVAQKLEQMPVPKSLRMIADDATPEELGRLLMSHSGRMAIISDEGDVFDLMAGKYSSGKANIGIYLHGHNGGDVLVDRVGRPDVLVRRVAITFGLCVQPESLLGLTSNNTFKGRGLIARFLFSVPYSRLGDRKIRPAPIPPHVSAAYAERITSLLDMPADEDEFGLPVPHLVPFAPEADDAVAEFEEWIEPQLRPAADLGYMGAWAGKLVGQTCRIATLLHMAYLAGTPEPWRQYVDAHTFRQARRIAEYLIPHAKAAFRDMGSDPAINQAHLVLAWVKKQGVPLFQKRDVFNAMRSQFERAAEVDAPLAVLLEHGYIRQIVVERKPRPGMAPSPTFRVHPVVLT